MAFQPDSLSRSLLPCSCGACLLQHVGRCPAAVTCQAVRTSSVRLGASRKSALMAFPPDSLSRSLLPCSCGACLLQHVGRCPAAVTCQAVRTSSVRLGASRKSALTLCASGGWDGKLWQGNELQARLSVVRLRCLYTGLCVPASVLSCGRALDEVAARREGPRRGAPGQGQTGSHSQARTGPME